VIATHNPGKLREMRELLAPYGIAAVSAGELGLAEPEETGASFRAMRASKRMAAAKARSCQPSPTIPAGGRALGGAGHPFGALGGPDKRFRRAMEAIESMLRDTAHDARLRTAHFVSRCACAWPDGHLEEFEARVDGTLVWPAARRKRLSATIRCSCRTDMTAPSARCRPTKSTDCRRAAQACRIARAPSVKLAEACLGR
jgi:XTP/dITP diphosphohydrolase